MTSTEASGCAVCGRSMLRGEKTRAYITEDGGEAAVCDLCKARAEAAGWVRADMVVAGEGPGRARKRGRSIGRVIAQIRARGTRGPGNERRAAEGEEREQRQEPRPRPKRPPAPERGETRLKRAVESFNGSDYRRTVAGLTRSLGSPRASVVPGPAPDAPILITVAWDLSWYQWEVDPDANGEAVREVAKGSEVTELGEGFREWNLSAAEDGVLEPGPADEERVRAEPG